MKILVATPAIPQPDMNSGWRRLTEILTILADRHDVTLWSAGGDDGTVLNAEPGVEDRGYATHEWANHMRRTGPLPLSGGKFGVRSILIPVCWREDDEPSRAEHGTSPMRVIEGRRGWTVQQHAPSVPLRHQLRCPDAVQLGRSDQLGVDVRPSCLRMC